MSAESEKREARHAERRYQLAVRRHLTRNFITHLFHGCFGQTGFRLLQAPTFLPAYILMLADGSNILVGIAIALQSIGMTLTPLIAAPLIEHRKRAVGVALTVGWLSRLMILVIAVAGWWLDARQALVVTFVALALFGMFHGVQGVVLQFVMSKVIPVAQRGRLTGLRNFTAGLVAAAVAYAGGRYFLGEDPTQLGYAQIFLLAFISASLGLLALSFMKEPTAPITKPRTGIWSALVRAPELLRADREYARFVAARTLATAGRMALPFYVLYAANHMSLSGTNLGVLTIAFAMAGSISNLGWGALADRKGFRLVFLLTIVLWVVSTLALMLSTTVWTTTLIFIGIGAAAQGFQQASNNLVLEFGKREDLPMRIAIANAAAEAAGGITTLIAGLIAAVAGYPVLFLISIAALTCGGILVRLFVPEPRFRGRFRS